MARAAALILSECRARQKPPSSLTRPHTGSHTDGFGIFCENFFLP
jgi:hypothetical protein